MYIEDTVAVTKNRMKFLKDLDAFKAPVNLYFHRRGSKNKKQHVTEMGSYIGGIMTIIAGMLLTGIISGLVLDMYNGRKDIETRSELTNPMRDGLNQANINDFHFLPTIEIRGMVGVEVLEEFDVLSDAEDSKAQDTIQFDM